VADWNDVREIARGLPEAEESATHSMPAYKFRGKLIFWMSPREEGALCVRVDRDERPLILESNPDLYFLTPHYESYPGVLVRLELIERDELEGRLEDAWLTRAPKRLAAEYLASRS
jgi:hypothetical protein